MKNKKGISLIVLIITIVVIIILGTAIIVNIAKTNVIDNANEAVVKQDFKTMQEELDLYIADLFASSKGTLDITTVDASTQDEVKKILKSSSKSKYIQYVTIEDGKIVMDKDAPADIKKFVKEVINIQIKTPVIQAGTEVTVANSSITGGKFLSTNPVIPVGFKTSDKGASWDVENGIVKGWNDGLVIVDGSGNEFVWVPCTLNGANGTIKYMKDFTYPNDYGATSKNTPDDADTLPSGVKDQKDQIRDYGGFYIGRYEAGVPANQTTIDGSFGDGETSKSNVEGIPVVKQDAVLWTNITYAKAKANSLAFCNTDNVKSGLVTGTEWDTVMKWIENSGINVATDSRAWGSYKDSISPANVTGYGKKQNTGYSEFWKAKNIYDLAGNAYEWTGECYSSYRILRGGAYIYSGKDYTSSYRYNCDPSGVGSDVAFRIVLYVM